MKILIVDDEKIFASQISRKLIKSWYDVDLLHNVTDFKKISNYNYDLYMLDISLWDWTWFDMIHHLREKEKSHAPIIIISWYSHVNQKVRSLDLWADDYLSKPFLPEELEARIRALLRRKAWVTNNSIIKHKSIKFDLSTREVTKWKKKISLTKKEKQIVEYFLFNKWVLIKKEDLIEKVWWSASAKPITENTVNVTISKVRKKLGTDFGMQTKINEWYILK